MGFLPCNRVVRFVRAEAASPQPEVSALSWDIWGWGEGTSIRSFHPAWSRFRPGAEAEGHRLGLFWGVWPDPWAEDDKMGADSSKAEAAPRACPLQLWAKPSAWEPAPHKDGIRGFLLVPVGSLGSDDWWRAGACWHRTRRSGEGCLRPGPASGRRRGDNVPGTQPLTRGSLPGSGFSARCNDPDRRAARVER